MSRQLTPFLSLCQDLGSDPLLIQGPGGNFSVKEDSSLWIKASGCLLKEVDSSRGWVEVDLERFLRDMGALQLRQQQGTEPTDELELAYAGAVKTSAKDPARRPSMELGFHAVIPHAWVTHTHSLAMQLLALDSDAPEFLHRALPDCPNLKILTVPYAIPGLTLSVKLSEAVQGIAASSPLAVFLQHHGFILAASTESEVRALTRKIESAGRERYGISTADWQTRIAPLIEGIDAGRKTLELQTQPRAREWLQSHVPFPDFAVLFPQGSWSTAGSDRILYDCANKSTSEARSAIEVWLAALYISEIGLARGLPIGINDPDIHRLRNLPTEKNRINTISGKGTPV